MSAGRAFGGSTGASLGGVVASTLEQGDPRLLGKDEVVIVLLRGEAAALSFVTGQEAVFGRTQVRLSLVSLKPTDLLGAACAFCHEQVEDPADLVALVRRAAVGDVLHEGCLRKWFVGQDKRALSPYRFATVAPGRVVADAAGDTVLVGPVSYEHGVEVAFLKSVEFTAVRASDPRAVAAGEREAVTRQGESGQNLFLCPRCTAPQRIPFLETEERIHQCAKCGARFQIVVRELKR